ncbi:MAG: peptidase [bacterium]
MTGCTSGSLTHNDKTGISPLVYEVDLTDHMTDVFRVKLLVDDLHAENAIYQFAATAPGTYQVMDIGRFVREFKAFDRSGQEVPVERISINQWQLSRPEQVHEIRYSIAETWDTPVDSNRIFPMAGTSIESDHVQINGHCVFGYPAGMQARPLRIKLHYPDSWQVGTALRRDERYFFADDFDHIVDSPLLLGRLSKAELSLKGSKIEIYTYSKTDKVNSDQILASVKDILLAAADFMDGLPVDHYAFLFHFEDVTYGAWEHSYSSSYAYSEANFEQLLQQSIPAVVAHEFFHVVTPLNIHSEIIEHFNFVEPVPSEHLWLYEGATEWAAHIMRLRSNLIDLNSYLRVVSRKLSVSDNFRGDYSLSDLSLSSFTPSGQQQYGNIYMRGAVVAGLLDILLLDLSQGKRGLREVINELAEVYGPEKAFSEKHFYDTFIDMTYPQIADFFKKYVKAAETLPLAAYYAKLGIDYSPEVHTGEEEVIAGFHIIVTDGRIALSKVREQVKGFGLRDGDILLAYNGEEVSIKNIRTVFAELRQLEAGVPYELTLSRDGEALTVTCQKIITERVDRHVLTVYPEATPEQITLRQAWMRNI